MTLLASRVEEIEAGSRFDAASCNGAGEPLPRGFGGLSVSIVRSCVDIELWMGRGVVEGDIRVLEGYGILLESVRSFLSETKTVT